MTVDTLNLVLKKLYTYQYDYITITTKSSHYITTKCRDFIECNDDSYEVGSNPPIVILDKEHTIYINLEDIESIML